MVLKPDVRSVQDQDLMHSRQLTRVSAQRALTFQPMDTTWTLQTSIIFAIGRVTSGITRQEQRVFLALVVFIAKRFRSLPQSVQATERPQRFHPV
jgi:hypothetical protein